MVGSVTHHHHHRHHHNGSSGQMRHIVMAIMLFLMLFTPSSLPSISSLSCQWQWLSSTSTINLMNNINDNYYCNGNNNNGIILVSAEMPAPRAAPTASPFEVEWTNVARNACQRAAQSLPDHHTAVC
jgi:hypothetical protein